MWILLKQLFSSLSSFCFMLALCTSIRIWHPFTNLFFNIDTLRNINWMVGKWFLWNRMWRSKPPLDLWFATPKFILKPFRAWFRLLHWPLLPSTHLFNHSYTWLDSLESGVSMTWLNVYGHSCTVQPSTLKLHKKFISAEFFWSKTNLALIPKTSSQLLLAFPIHFPRFTLPHIFGSYPKDLSSSLYISPISQAPT